MAAVDEPVLPRWRVFWMVVGVINLAIIMYLALVPLKQVLPPIDWSDKALHFVVFAGLMVWFAALVKPAAYGWVLVALLVYGGAMEVMQSIMPFRQAEFADFVADFAGLLVGWGVCRLGLARWPHWVEGLFRRA
ncbi:MAG: VanZ family protein [Gammaproteobacteria bacterium]|nr:VanZ family protein [Gammaproteobacteria bacterium]